MELIRRNTDYALRALVLMAKDRTGDVYVVTRLANEARVPEDFLRKTLQRLDKAGIIESKRGPKGGFQLSKDPARISVLDVMEAVQGPLAVNRCFLKDIGCDNFNRCELKEKLIGAQQHMVDLFKSVTIRELAAERG